MASASPEPHPAVPLLLSLNAGYVDTAGFLALQGLFTAHVTGNFVTLGASLAFGTSGALAKLLALPTFCIVVLAARLVGQGLPGFGLPILPTMLILKVLLLVVAAVLAIGFGPFPNGDATLAIVTGLTLVAAMAIQNAVHRLHMSSFPPTNLMTGTTTQIMIEIADILLGRAEGREARRVRLTRMLGAVGAFALGCAAAALLYFEIGVWAFALPPVIGAMTLLPRFQPREA